MLSIKIEDKDYELSCTFGVMLAIEDAIGDSILSYVTSHLVEGNKHALSMPMIHLFNAINLATDSQIPKNLLEEYILKNFSKVNYRVTLLFWSYLSPDGAKEMLESVLKEEQEQEKTEDSKKNDTPEKLGCLPN